MQFAQDQADRYRRHEYAGDDPEQVHLVPRLAAVVTPAVGTGASLTVTLTALAPFHRSAHIPSGMAIA